MNMPRIGSSILYLKSCPNSMDAAKEHLAFLHHGTILSIKNLVAARGRQGRVWMLAPGQLVMTFILKPTQSLVDRPDSLHYLFMAISLIMPIITDDFSLIFTAIGDATSNNFVII